MHFAKFYDYIRKFGERLRIEEKRRGIHFVEIYLLGFRDNGRQLLHVAYHQQLHASERLVGTAVTAQHHIHSVHKVSAHHRDFIYYQQVQRPEYVYAFAAQVRFVLRQLIFCHKFLYIREIWTERQLEEGVYGDASGIDCRHPGRGDDGAALVAAFDYMAQKGGLSRTRLAGKEETQSCFTNISFREQETLVFLNHHCFGNFEDDRADLLSRC